MKKTIITFLKVSDNQSKLLRICETIKSHFERGHSILITVGSEEVAQFIDNLLWRIPEESFLPHEKGNKSTKEAILITTTQENLNNASVLFNLCASASQLCAQFDHIYELLDETHEAKLAASQARLTAYKAAGYDTVINASC